MIWPQVSNCFVGWEGNCKAYHILQDTRVVLGFEAITEGSAVLEDGH